MFEDTYVPTHEAQHGPFVKPHGLLSTRCSWDGGTLGSQAFNEMKNPIKVGESMRNSESTGIFSPVKIYHPRNPYGPMVQSWILFILVIERGIGEELDLDQVLRFRNRSSAWVRRCGLRFGHGWWRVQHHFSYPFPEAGLESTNAWLFNCLKLLFSGFHFTESAKKGLNQGGVTPKLWPLMNGEGHNTPI